MSAVSLSLPLSKCNFTDTKSQTRALEAELPTNHPGDRNICTWERIWFALIHCFSILSAQWNYNGALKHTLTRTNPRPAELEPHGWSPGICILHPRWSRVWPRLRTSVLSILVSVLHLSKRNPIKLFLKSRWEDLVTIFFRISINIPYKPFECKVGGSVRPWLLFLC